MTTSFDPQQSDASVRTAGRPALPYHTQRFYTDAAVSGALHR